MSTTLTHVLTDPTHDRATRLLRLQGWRDDELRQAAAAGRLLRLGPAVCAAGTLLGGMLRSPVLVGLLAVSAAVGALTPHHPVELVANAIGRRTGHVPIPPHRFGRQAGCLMGAVVLTVATVALVTGPTAVGAALAVGFGVVAAFVATTGVCVPSILVSLVVGPDACTRAATSLSRPGAR